LHFEFHSPRLVCRNILQINIAHAWEQAARMTAPFLC